jgi:FMN reductase
MRPLFGFFQALTLPLGIFASEADFTDYRVSSPELQSRIATTMQRTLPVIVSHLGIEPNDTLRGHLAEFARPAVF